MTAPAAAYLPFLLMGAIALTFAVVAARALAWRGRKAALFALAFMAAGGGLYASLGSPSLVPATFMCDVELKVLHQEMIVLRTHLAADEADAQGWAELGHAAMLAGEYGESAEAFKRAVLLSQGSPSLIAQYAMARVFEAGGSVTPEAKRSFEMVRKLDPQNPQARYFLAVAELQAGNAQAAMRQMKALYHDLPEDSPVRHLIDRQIGRE